MIKLYVDVSYVKRHKRACWGGILYGIGDKPYVFGGQLEWVSSVNFLDVMAIDEALKRTKALLRRRGYTGVTTLPIHVYNDNQSIMEGISKIRPRPSVSHTWLSREHPRMKEADYIASQYRKG